MQPSPSLSIQAIQSHLTTRSLGRRIELYERLDSTNREAVAVAQAGAEHGTLVLADSQTAGRGRMARTWFSPPGLNVYASVVIRPAVDGPRLAAWLSWLPLMAALAAAQAIEAVASIKIALKWPNDLLAAERKLGGILCESGTASATGPFQVVGLGINVNGSTADFPKELRDSATTVRQETGGLVDRNRLAACLLNELECRLDEFLAGGPERIAITYRSRCATIGKTVKAILPDGNQYMGVAEAVAEDGSLTLTQRLGSEPPTVRQVRAADIVHLR